MGVSTGHQLICEIFYWKREREGEEGDGEGGRESDE